jgi:hypothetical protein
VTSLRPGIVGPDAAREYNKQLDGMAARLRTSEKMRVAELNNSAVMMLRERQQKLWWKIYTQLIACVALTHVAVELSRGWSMILSVGAIAIGVSAALTLRDAKRNDDHLEALRRDTLER